MLTKRLKELRAARGLTLEEVARLIGTSRQTVHRYETGRIANVPPEKVEALAAALAVTPADLMGWSDADALPPPPAAEPFVPSPIGTLDYDLTFVMRGDAMEDARLYDGDLVYVKEGDPVPSGSVAALTVDDRTLIRRVFLLPEQNALILSPDRVGMPPEIFVGEERSRVKIIGRAVAFSAFLP